jgi:hypothetical protein
MMRPRRSTRRRDGCGRSGGSWARPLLRR